MKNEIIWKDVPNFSDRYEVSNMGQVTEASPSEEKVRADVNTSRRERN